MVLIFIFISKHLNWDFKCFKIRYKNTVHQKERERQTETERS